MGIDDNEEGQSLDKFKDEDERKNIGYVPFPFVTFPCSQKKSNRPTNICKRTKRLNHFVCIPKIGLLYNC